VYELKQRPRSHPLIVHLGAARELADCTRDAPPLAWLLAERYWPGPLTLILRRSPRVPDSVSGGQDTVGVRVPAHPLALELIARAGVPLAAPSANRFQHLSPTRAEHVRAAFGDALCVLDGGPASGGIESTILDLSGETPRLLRPGLVTREELEPVCGVLAIADAAAPRASGSHPLHYAPRARVELIGSGEWRRELAVAERTAVLLPHELAADVPAELARLVTVLPGELAEAARGLYAALHELDARGFARILVVLPPERALGAAIADRLRRAAGRGADARQ
jgi:L-threonylcarbamoyladenylate synthase